VGGNVVDSVLGSNPEELQCTYAFNLPGGLLRERSRCPWVRAWGLEVILVQLLFVMGSANVMPHNVSWGLCVLDLHGLLQSAFSHRECPKVQLAAGAVIFARGSA